MRYILIAAVSTLLSTAEFTVNQNSVGLLIALVSTVGVVVASLKYIDNKIDHKVKNYSDLVNAQLMILETQIENLDAKFDLVLKNHADDRRNFDVR